MNGWLKKQSNRGVYRWMAIFAIPILLGSVLFYRAEVPQVIAQSSVSSLNSVTAAVKGQKVLVFSPHPDDETIGVGGYIAASRKEGADVKIVLVTNGDWHHQRDERYSEFEKATAILGVTENDLVFLNFPDAKLRQQNQSVLYAAFKEQLDAYNPDIVIIPLPQDYNPDHSTIGKIMETILKAEQQKRTVYEYLVHYEILYPSPRKYDTNLFLSPPKKLITSDRWQRFELSQDVEDLKKTAIFAYKTQLDDPWLNGLLLSHIRRNELLAISKDLGDTIR